MSVTDDRWTGLSETCKSNLSDVRRALRVVAPLFVVQAKGKEANQSNSTGGRMKVRAPRLVARFV